MTDTGFKLYTVEDVANILHLTPRTVREYLKAQKLKGVKIGKAWNITEENLRAFLNGEG